VNIVSIVLRGGIGLWLKQRGIQISVAPGLNIQSILFDSYTPASNRHIP
jgi:hypothetical protein